ncbi:hypothetical protein CMI47_19005 [Candidatus Pacearchaeota archaeon]|nr:hypothetical protein [Candidatus Pacearchaeota archaeon]|tara:strand:- start:9125 stop:9406 length:282 start_codon:yes stop_codon:yes gene_type:complete
MGISWDFFVGRRRVNVKNFFKKNNIRTKSDFIDVLVANDITVPDDSTVDGLVLLHGQGDPDLFRPKKEVIKQPKAEKKDRVKNGKKKDASTKS